MSSHHFNFDFDNSQTNEKMSDENNNNLYLSDNNPNLMTSLDQNIAPFYYNPKSTKKPSILSDDKVCSGEIKIPQEMTDFYTNSIAQKKPNNYSKYIQKTLFNEMELQINLQVDKISFLHFNSRNNKKIKEMIDDTNKNNDIFFGIMTNCFASKELSHTEKINKIFFLTQPQSSNFLENFSEIDKTKMITKNGNIYIDTSNNKLVIPATFYDLYYNINNYSIHFIFLDTNLFNYKIITDRFKYMEAKKKLNEMFQWLKYILLNNAADIIFIVGNDPIFNLNEDKMFSKVDTLLNILHNFVKNTDYNKEVYYLCGTDNNFQHIRFTGKECYSGLIIYQFAIGNIWGHQAYTKEINIEHGKIFQNQQGNNIGFIELLDNDPSEGYLQYTIEPNANPIIVYKIS
jgi:L-rhamnose mutarotase